MARQAKMESWSRDGTGTSAEEAGPQRYLRLNISKLVKIGEGVKVPTDRSVLNKNVLS